jgi:hypothetical protein
MWQCRTVPRAPLAQAEHGIATRWRGDLVAAEPAEGVVVDELRHEEIVLPSSSGMAAEMLFQMNVEDTEEVDGAAQGKHSESKGS